MIQTDTSLNLAILTYLSKHDELGVDISKLAPEILKQKDLNTAGTLLALKIPEISIQVMHWVLANQGEGKDLGGINKVIADYMSDHGSETLSLLELMNGCVTVEDMALGLVDHSIELTGDIVFYLLPDS